MNLPRYTRRSASLLLVVTVTAYWGLSGDNGLSTDADTSDADRVDSYLLAAQIRQFDERGLLSRTLEADRIEHQTASDSHHLDAPRLTLNRDRRPPVEISAREAVTSDDDSLLELRHEVKLQPRSELPNQLRTEQLFVRPDTRFAWTAEPVAYYRGDTSLQAVGMNAYFDRDRIELLNDVRGLYAVD